MADEPAQNNTPALPYSPDFGPDDYVELVGHACKECPASGPWTRTIRDGSSGRCTQYDQWDMEHSKATGHKKFYQYRMSRVNGRIL